MMNMKQRILDEERLQDFVGDFNEHFEDLAKRYEKDAEEVKNIREYFWRKYPEIFDDSSDNGDEMDVDVDTTIKPESRPIVDREEKLRKVEKRLLSKRTNERFTNYDGVMSDDNLSLPQKIIHLQKAIGDATRRKIHYASLQGELLENAFINRRSFVIVYNIEIVIPIFFVQLGHFLQGRQHLLLGLFNSRF